MKNEVQHLRNENLDYKNVSRKDYLQYSLSKAILSSFNTLCNVKAQTTNYL